MSLHAFRFFSKFLLAMLFRVRYLSNEHVRMTPMFIGGLRCRSTNNNDISPFPFHSNQTSRRFRLQRLLRWDCARDLTRVPLQFWPSWIGSRMRTQNMLPGHLATIATNIFGTHVRWAGAPFLSRTSCDILSTCLAEHVLEYCVSDWWRAGIYRWRQRVSPEQCFVWRDRPQALRPIWFI